MQKSAKLIYKFKILESFWTIKYRENVSMLSWILYYNQVTSVVLKDKFSKYVACL